jgi:hypothetical protein
MSKEKKTKANEEVFPGGPTRNQVENWKQQFGDIYQIDFEEDTYIYRTISRFEYKQLMNNIEGNQDNPQGGSGDPSQTGWFREEQICNSCVIWPEDYNHEAMGEGKAGVPTVIAEYVMSSSGFNSDGGPKKL